MDGELNPYGYALPRAKDIAETLSREPDVAAVFPSTGFVAIAGLTDQSANTPRQRLSRPSGSYFAAQDGDRSHLPTDRFNLGTLIEGSKSDHAGEAKPARAGRDGLPASLRAKRGRRRSP